MSQGQGLRITFPGGKKVDAEIGGRVIRTDQPARAGGDDSAPMPFELFLASIGTCAGIYVLGFLQSRGLTTEGVEILETVSYDDVSHAVQAVGLEIKLPSSVPEKYHDAIIRAADICAVKKTIQAQPKFEVKVSKD